jgi:hypothetical protein
MNDQAERCAEAELRRGLLAEFAEQYFGLGGQSAGAIHIA